MAPAQARSAPPRPALFSQVQGAVGEAGHQGHNPEGQEGLQAAPGPSHRQLWHPGRRPLPPRQPQGAAGGQGLAPLPVRRGESPAQKGATAGRTSGAGGKVGEPDSGGTCGQGLWSRLGLWQEGGGGGEGRGDAGQGGPKERLGKQGWGGTHLVQAQDAESRGRSSSSYAKGRGRPAASYTSGGDLLLLRKLAKDMPKGGVAEERGKRGCGGGGAADGRRLVWAAGGGVLEPGRRAGSVD